MQQQALEIPVTPRYGFENFIPCSGNATAFEFSRRIVTGKGPEKVLYIYGPSGSGKTHLLHAIAEALPKENTRVVSCADLAEINTDLGFKLLSSSNAMIVDEIDRLPAIPSSKNMLWEAFNRHHAAGHIVVLAGRVQPRDLKNLDEHLTSRLLWGLVASMDVSDDSSRKMLIAKLASDRQIRLPDDVASWLLTVLPRDVASLVNACDTLYRAALVQQKKISLRLARDIFKVTIKN